MCIKAINILTLPLNHHNLRLKFLVLSTRKNRYSEDRNFNTIKYFILPNGYYTNLQKHSLYFLILQYVTVK